VLIRDPYDKASRYTSVAPMAEVFNDLGLVVVAQDCRGKFRSEGVTLPYASDVEDAYDTIECIIQQLAKLATSSPSRPTFVVARGYAARPG
jgi:uncharacterized protein